MKARILLLLFAAIAASGDALDDAVGTWSKRISTHLAPDEVAQIAWRESAATDANASAYISRAKISLARALQRRLKEPKPVEITATFSQNLKEYLMVAEIHRENENIVEIASLPRAVPITIPAAAFRLERKLLWKQETPILDVATNIDSAGDRMLVLDTAGVTLLERRDAKWQIAETGPVEFPAVRDPRGRLTVTDDTLIAEAAGQICKGTWRPSLTIECQPGGRFTAGRNTIDEPGWIPYFAHAQIGGEHIVAGADGRTYIYDAMRRQVNAFDTWGDFAIVASACTGGKVLAADSASALTVFDLLNHGPVRVSDAMELPGAITAIWADGAAGFVVVRNKNQNWYEAYSVGVDCGR